jgi:hypothetical protein
MSDLATDLKKIFDAWMFDRLEAYWVLPDGKYAIPNSNRVPDGTGPPGAVFKTRM